MTKSLKYLLALTIPMIGCIALMNEGIWAWSGLLYSFVLLPILDHVLPVNSRNYDSETIKQMEGDRFYNLILISLIPIQLFFLTWFLLSINDPALSSSTFYGRIFSMGILCGVIGINVGHELGHRTQKSLQFGAKILLSTTLYNHFFVEHNYGHHKNVGTPEDAASANRDEWVYFFMVRSAVLGWINAWKIESKRLKRKGVSVVSFQNEVLRWQLLQWFALLIVFVFVGPVSGFAWIGAAVAGAGLLEATNYVEHYGLVRNKVSEHRYESVEVYHSWNSDHVMGRIILFEVTRHSDHHHSPHKSYQTLRSAEGAPHLPTGYPGMIVLSLFCPLFIAIMNKKIDTLPHIVNKV